MSITATQFRKDLYQLLANVVDTGETIKINLKGSIINVSPQSKPSKLSKLKHHNVLACEPEELLNNDWSNEWSEEHI